MRDTNKITSISPGRVIIFSFFFIIAIGVFLLSLPISRTTYVPFIDILFMSATSTCVAGLSTVSMSNFTTFGHVVIMCLIQLGGLGLMTFSFFFISLFLNLGMTTQILAGKILDIGSWAKVKKYLGIIIITTFVAELVGAFFLYFPLRERFPAGKAAFYALFHSISAFCNAGLDLLGDGVVSFQNRPLVLLTFAALIFSGGIGFFIWFELANKAKPLLKRFFKKTNTVRISLHAKLTLITTTSLIFLGTIITWLLERNVSLKHLSLYNSFFVAFTHSVSIRSAGFKFFDLRYATFALLLLFIVLMFIGANSGSTGGGIKTTTWAVFVATIAAIVRNREDVEFFGRKIQQNQVYTAIAIVVLSSLWIIFATFLLLISELHLGFLDVVFETVSAFGTCGLSTGVTSQLTSFGKAIIVITMFVGRIGSLTMVLALSGSRKKHLYKFPEERVAIG
jgi:trk system potassium uptake protein TrkH